MHYIPTMLIVLQVAWDDHGDKTVHTTTAVNTNVLLCSSMNQLSVDHTNAANLIKCVPTKFRCPLTRSIRITVHSPHLPLNGIAVTEPVTEPDVSVVLIRANLIQAYHQRNLYQERNLTWNPVDNPLVEWLRNLLIVRLITQHTLKW